MGFFIHGDVMGLEEKPGQNREKHEKTGSHAFAVTWFAWALMVTAGAAIASGLVLVLEFWMSLDSYAS